MIWISTTFHKSHVLGIQLISKTVHQMQIQVPVGSVKSLDTYFSNVNILITNLRTTIRKYKKATFKMNS